MANAFRQHGCVMVTKIVPMDPMKRRAVSIHFWGNSKRLRFCLTNGNGMNTTENGYACEVFRENAMTSHKSFIHRHTKEQ